MEAYTIRSDSLNTRKAYEPRRQASGVTGRSKKEIGTPLQSGGHRLNHGLNDGQEMERLYADWVDECEQNETQFTDPDFQYDDQRNFGGIGKKNYRRIPDDAKFIVNGIDTFDVSQGRLGNCWFLSSISALAQKTKFIKRVLMPQYNNQPEAMAAGIYRFRFYRMGEWMDVIIDDLLPRKHHAKVTDNEYWVPLVEKGTVLIKYIDPTRYILPGTSYQVHPIRYILPGTLDRSDRKIFVIVDFLIVSSKFHIKINSGDLCITYIKTLQKAYAKFFGCYQMIIGGEPCWALCNLTGGITISVTKLSRKAVNQIKKHRQFDLFDWITQNKDRAVFCTSNTSLNEEVEGLKGLVAGHAYSLLDTVKVELVQIRNPWAKIEWNGDWSDNSSKWSTVIESDRKKYQILDDSDGSFWMSYDDWVLEFETLDICYLPDERSSNNHRVIGDFRCGINAPRDLKELQQSYLKPNMTHQIIIEVKQSEQTVLFQYLLNCSVREPFYLTFNLFTNLAPRGDEYDRKALKDGIRLEPIFPAQTGYQIDYYRHNGYIFKLKPGRYVAVISAAPKVYVKLKPIKFVLRAIGDNIGIQHLVDQASHRQRIQLAQQQLGPTMRTTHPNISGKRVDMNNIPEEILETEVSEVTRTIFQNIRGGAQASVDTGKLRRRGAFANRETRSFESLLY